MKKKKISQIEFIKEYFVDNPNRDIATPEVVDFVTKKYEKQMKRKFRDPDRKVRDLAQKGFLIKVDDGIYRYEPSKTNVRKLENFTPAQKKIILERDGYKCVICDKGKEDGVKLHVDHIKSKDSGGEAKIENGQTLCSQHNFIKKNLNQTETGKKLFIRLYELAKSEGNTELQNFTAELLEVFEKHQINGHIKWEK
jgi:hypothetical protein